MSRGVSMVNRALRLVSLCVFPLTICPTPTDAATTQRVCAVYQDTNAGYVVDAEIAQGTELNSATGTFAYDVFGTYAVIFWAPGQASAIRLSYYFGTFGILGVDGTDQQGHQWHLSNANSLMLCGDTVVR